MNQINKYKLANKHSILNFLMVDVWTKYSTKHELLDMMLRGKAWGLAGD